MAITLNQIPESWDLIVVGGGITGAGIFREAVARGVRALLLEKRDFAWGTSSRSSKLVHGGLRYLKQGRLGLTRAAVKERELLLREAPGLVTPIPFIMPLYKGRAPRRWEIKLGLTIYDLLSGRRQHRFLNNAQVTHGLPQLRRAGLTGAYQFLDAQTDDARLVLRLISDGIALGGVALNYTEAVAVLRSSNGSVKGLGVADSEGGTTRQLRAGVVINATGVWADRLDPQAGRKLGLRPLRGSHLILRREALPLDQAVSFLHPDDRRAVFVVPWEGVVLVGTTDLDHDADLDAEPAISRGEVEYLLSLLAHYFPDLEFRRGACVGTMAGVRPILGHGRGNPSAESREHAVQAEKGLITVTGGKLTTFRILARDALRASWVWLPKLKETSMVPLFEVSLEKGPANLAERCWRTLSGRYGTAAARLLAESEPTLLQPIDNTGWLWAELCHAARNENIRHLDDLLMRRVRVGLVRAQGSIPLLDRVQAVCAPHLSWDAIRWQDERRRYEKICRRLFEPIAE